MSQSAALASLTATYTDSEDEDETSHDIQTSETSQTSSQPDSPPHIKVTTRVSRLVSYIDDTIVSDDESNETAQHDVIILTEDVPKVKEEDEVEIPPEPLGSCSMDVLDKISKLYEKMQNEQVDMNALIQKRKDFRNPSIYEKLISFCAIDELGTNYPPNIYDPVKWDKQSYYEELAKVQKTEMDKREKERKSKVEFVSGTKKQEEDKKRKSKWDQPGGNQLGSQSLKPAGLIQPALTSNATGTKSTVISAFGSLPKKPRL